MSDLLDSMSIYQSSDSRRRKKTFWLFALLQVLCGILLVTVLINVGLVLFWPGGLDLLKDIYAQEVTYIRLNMDSDAIAHIDTWVNNAYHWVFVKTRLHSYLHISAMLQGVMIGFQILMIRLSIILLMLPFIVLIIFVAVCDGYLGWYKRRTGGMRESGFIYHRSKKIVGWGMLGLWTLYLVIPVAVDPAFIFIPSLAITGIATRLTVQFFKKYL